MNMNLRWIRRVDNPQNSTHCWKVEVKRRNVHMHKYFSDNVFGSKDKALEAAIAYRDVIIPKVSGVDYSLWLRKIKRSNNTSGIIGVGRYVVRAGNTEYPYWQAFWRDADGKRVSRTFTIEQYGEEGARERACEARREGLKDVAQELKRRLKKQSHRKGIGVKARTGCAS